MLALLPLPPGLLEEAPAGMSLCCLGVMHAFLRLLAVDRMICFFVAVFPLSIRNRLR